MSSSESKDPGKQSASTDGPPVARRSQKNDRRKAEASEIQRLKEELASAKSYLQSVIQAQEASNEELKDAQETTLQAERLASIGQMSTGLAHESRNALQRSQSCLEMLAAEVQGQERALGLIARLQEAQDYLLALYEGVRDYAAPLTLHREPRDLRRLLEDVWEELDGGRSGKKAVLRVETDKTDGRATVDAMRMRQVFRNLMENSLAACPGDSEIVVGISASDSVPLPSGDQSRLRIIIRDNGPGISPQARARVFEPFSTVKTHGTGLGLAIAQRIIEAHGGSIEIGDPDGKGTEIIIELPTGNA